MATTTGMIDMLTVSIPEWVVWVFIIMWAVQLVLKVALSYVTKENSKASAVLVATLERVNKSLEGE